MSAILDAEDLRRLTGYIRASKQVEYLVRHHIPHRVNAAGDPVVMAEQVLDKSAVTEFELGPVR